MRRRDFLVFVGASALALNLADHAYGAGKIWRIGVLAQDLQPGLLDAFRAGLRDLGYAEGENIAIEVCNAAGRNDRLVGMVDDLLTRKVNVILAVNTPAAQAAKKATSSVPIVM